MWPQPVCPLLSSIYGQNAHAVTGYSLHRRNQKISRSCVRTMTKPLLRNLSDGPTRHSCHPHLQPSHHHARTTRRPNHQWKPLQKALVDRRADYHSQNGHLRRTVTIYRHLSHLARNRSVRAQGISPRRRKGVSANSLPEGWNQSPQIDHCRPRRICITRLGDE